MHADLGLFFCAFKVDFFFVTVGGTYTLAGENKTQDICFVFIDGAQKHKSNHK
jgi:hypothetical protein